MQRHKDCVQFDLCQKQDSGNSGCQIGHLYHLIGYLIYNIDQYGNQVSRLAEEGLVALNGCTTGY